MLRLALALVASAALSAGAAGAQAAPASEVRTSERAVSIGPYTGVAIGTLDRFRRIQNDQFTSNSADFYRARFTYSFQISVGIVSGTGTGAYLAATWRLDGVHHGVGSFRCDVPVHTQNFGVRVTGSANDDTITLFFEMVGSREWNEDHDCGGDFTGFASDSSRLASSLQLVQQPNGITTPREQPRIAPLSKLEQIGEQGDRRVNLHEWAFTIAAPGAPPPPDPPVGGGGGGSGGQPAPIRLVGTVGPRATITLTLDGRRVSILPARPYTILVRDRSRVHNFHLTGPGVNRRTPLARTGTFTWNVTLRRGTYRYVSDRRPPRLQGSVIVG